MKKKLMIGLAALALATGIGAAAGIRMSVADNSIETKADDEYDAPAYHVIEGKVESLDLDGWGSTKEIGIWNGTYFTVEINLAKDEYFGFHVGKNSGSRTWVGPATGATYDDSELTNDDNHFRVLKAGLYSFTWNASSITAERISFRDQDAYKDGDEYVYIQPKDSWLADGAKLAIWYFGASNIGHWSPFLTDSDLDDDGFYKYSFADYFASDDDAEVITTIIVVKFAAGQASPDWDQKKAQTSNLVADKHLNCAWLPNTPGNSDGGWFAQRESLYKVRVGGTTVTELNVDLLDKSKVSQLIKVDAGDQIEISNDDGAHWLNAGGEDEYPNNMDTDGIVKVSKTDVRIYVPRSNWSNCWLLGYSPDSVRLQNFCEYLLHNTTNGSTCSVSEAVLANLKKMYGVDPSDRYYDDNYNMTSTDIDNFRGVSPLYGSHSYTTGYYASVVQEAMTRYCWLVKASIMEDFAKINPAAQTVAALPASNSSASVVVITILSVAFLAMAAGFVFYRKKHQAE